MHHRLQPKRHRFSYGMFLLGIDLDELTHLTGKLRLLGIGRRNLFSFREEDYLPGPAPRLKDRVHALAAERGMDLRGGTVMLVTLPRMLGYVFNPVSFYFCSDRHGRPAAAIAEVTNTFGERKPFFLGADALRAGGVFRSRQAKQFYVSPYSDLDVGFDFRLDWPAEQLRIQIDDYTGEARTLTSTLTGNATGLTDKNLLRCFFAYPLLTLRVIYLIHWHALRLWLKRVPWYPHGTVPVVRS